MSEIVTKTSLIVVKYVWYTTEQTHTHVLGMFYNMSTLIWLFQDMYNQDFIKDLRKALLIVKAKEIDGRG